MMKFNDACQDLTFRQADKTDILHLKELWQTCFFENPQALSVIFDEYFSQMSVYCACTSDNKITSAVYLINGSLNGVKAHYLCGAATLQHYRGRGIMSALIEYALKEACKNGDVYSLLLPANESLYNFYSKLGYIPACYKRKVILSRKDLCTESIKNIEPNCSLNSNLDLQNLQKHCLVNDFFLYQDSFFAFAFKYHSAYNIKVLKNQNCIALIDENSDYADVFYAVYQELEQLKQLLLCNTTADKFQLTINTNNSDFASYNDEVSGMIKPLKNDAKVPNNAYIGITLS